MEVMDYLDKEDPSGIPPNSLFLEQQLTTTSFLFLLTDN